jgi:hypothetical protein
MNNISKKRIFFVLSPLIVFNFVLLADLLFFHKDAQSQSSKDYEYSRDQRIYTSEETQEVKSGDKTLYRYEGADANCWKLKDDYSIQRCLSEHPYGGQGTMIIGGNMVVDDAEAIYLNGYDSAGFNWIMSSTSEPYGNAIGTTRGAKNSNVLHGNHLLVEGKIGTGGVQFRASAITIFYNGETKYMVNDAGAMETVGRLVVRNMHYGNNPNGDILSILERGVCGMCDGACSDGKAGKDYRFITKHGLDIKEMLKVNEQIRLCGVTKECEEACCRIVEYLSDDTHDNFLGAKCTDTPCMGEPKPDKYGQGANYCFPQPYPKYEDKSDPDPITEYSAYRDGYYWR